MKSKISIFFVFFFILHNAIADIFCNELLTGFMAIYEKNTHSCSTGYFLPANTDNCVICPESSTCTGGFFTFNENEFQGMIINKEINTTINNACAANFPNTWGALYKPNTHTCNSGYYLPVGVDGCRVCPENHYCAGGTYTFNETTDQGINACPSAHPFAPAGMWLESQCGRKLHIGDDVLYMHQNPSNPTLHRLFVQYGNMVYSANAVPKQIGVNGPKMSGDADNELHVTIGDYEYVVCDDSVPECRND